MQQLDLKDRKILYELDLNCGQSNEQIGKKVGLSKEAESEAIDTGFNTFEGDHRVPCRMPIKIIPRNEIF